METESLFLSQKRGIKVFIEEVNHDPKPFVWTADPDKIIAAVKRGNQALGSIH